jgi:hypothetical protein
LRLALLVSCLLHLLVWIGSAQAQSDSTHSSFPANASLPYPPSLQDNNAPERSETSAAQRRQRYDASTAKKIALIPVQIVKVPLQVVNYPLEHWLVMRVPPAFVQRTEFHIKSLLRTGVTLRYGGFGVGSGSGGGLGYRTLVPCTKTYAKAFVGATFTGYQQYYVDVDRRFGDRSTLFSRSQFFDQPRIEFYGVGLQSDASRESSYRQQTSSVSLSGETAFRRRSLVHWQLGYQNRHLKRGLKPGVPASVDLFPASEVEGLRGDYDLLQAGVGIALDGRDQPSYAQRGTLARASLQLTTGLGDQSGLKYTKYRFELQQFVPLPGVRRTLAMRLHSVITDNQSSGGRSVPVWALEQLGGGESVRIVPNSRYTDEDLVVANLEYRFPFWYLEHDSGVLIDALTWFDCGTVLPDLTRLQQDDLRSSAGFGFRMVLRQATLFKLDIGWTSQNFRLDAGVRGPL